VAVRSGYRLDLPGVAWHEAPRLPGPLLDQVWLPRLARRLAPDVVHLGSLAAPLRRLAAPTLLTIHDVTLWRWPETASLRGRRYYRPVTDAALRRGTVDAVVTVSEASARELAPLVPVPVHVTPNGLDETLLDGVAEPRPEPYLLTVGTLEPRKNLSALLDGYALLRERRPELGLVVVGRLGWKEHAPELPGVRFAGTVDDDALAALYRGASALVLASLHEGFGLPLLEALALGVPAVVSDIAAFPELGGDAVLTFDPRDPGALAQQVERVLDDASLAAELVRLGRERAATFTWERAAALTVDVYRELAGIPALEAVR
jgi:glycosyltransferase involved in cell wall biosynthesis